MHTPTTFLDILEEQMNFFQEESFVKTNKKETELPGLGDKEEAHASDEAPEQPPEEAPAPEDPSAELTEKEKHLLKLAHAFYHENDKYDENQKSDLYALKEAEDWENLYQALDEIHGFIA
jgi:hypothetical protein